MLLIHAYASSQQLLIVIRDPSLSLSIALSLSLSLHLTIPSIYLFTNLLDW
jgi:hypothetical protein